MNIVYLFGNGFDINLGLKTKYKDFYDYYQTVPNKKAALIELKESIKKSIDDDIDWSDLEIALGKYCNKFKSNDEFEEVYNDIVDNLGEYLEEQERKYTFSENERNILKRDLLTPQRFLTESDQEVVSNFLRAYRQNWNVSIITFNYTHTVERILNYQSSEITLGNNMHGYTSTMKNIQHIHGYTNNRMVLGVNDDSQVSNSDLLKDPYFRQNIIKSECNKAQKTLHVKRCEETIKNANLICLYGLSIGETDKIWWNQIAESLRRNGSKLLIFTYSSKQLSERRSHKRQQLEDEIINRFLSNTKLTDSDKSVIRSNIVVSFNSEIFKMNPQNILEQKAG